MSKKHAPTRIESSSQGVDPRLCELERAPESFEPTNERNRICYVYEMRCDGHDGIYIGSTMRSYKQRWSEHLWYLRNGKHHCSRLQNCLDKYGEEALRFSVIEEVVDANLLLAREQFQIWRVPEKELMNSVPVSDSTLIMRIVNIGRVMSAEERRRRSKALRGITRKHEWTPKRRAAHSKALKGRKMPAVSDETRRKISEAKKGKAPPRAAIESSVATRQGFIVDEVQSWVAMRKEGLSYREIGRRTGRSRDVIARECKRLESQRS